MSRKYTSAIANWREKISNEDHNQNILDNEALIGNIIDGVINFAYKAEVDFVADSGSTTTIVDSALGTNANKYIGAYVVVKDGTNRGYERKITDYNTGTKTLTVDAFPVACDSTTKYDILWKNLLVGTDSMKIKQIGASNVVEIMPGYFYYDKSLVKFEQEIINEVCQSNTNVSVSTNQLIKVGSTPSVYLYGDPDHAGSNYYSSFSGSIITTNALPANNTNVLISYQPIRTYDYAGNFPVSNERWDILEVRKKTFSKNFQITTINDAGSAQTELKQKREDVSWEYRVRQGTASATPVKPDTDPDWIPLGYVRVSTSAILEIDNDSFSWLRVKPGTGEGGSVSTFSMDKDYYFSRNSLKLANCSSTEFWDNNSWSGGVGTVGQNQTQYLLDNMSISCSVAVDSGGVHFNKIMDMAKFEDGNASTTSDFVTLAIYMPTTEQTKMASDSYIQLLFPCNAQPAMTDLFRYSIPKASFTVNGWNFFKVKKSDFTIVGSADWSSVQGISIRYFSDTSTAPSSTMSFSFDAIQMYRVDPISSTDFNPFQREVNSVWTREAVVNYGWWYVGKEFGTSVIVRDINPSNVGSLTYASSLIGVTQYGDFEITGYLSQLIDGNSYGVNFEIDSTNRIKCYLISGTFYLVEDVGGTAVQTKSQAFGFTMNYPVDLQMSLKRIGNSVSAKCRIGSSMPEINLSFNTAVTGLGYLALTSKGTADRNNLYDLSITSVSYATEAGNANALGGVQAQVILGNLNSSAIDTVDMYCDLKKNGAVLSDSPNSYSIAEAFTKPNTLSLTLAKDYSTSDGTIIYLNPNVFVWNTMDATTGWTPSTGSVSADTTNKVQGTGSVAHNITSLNGSADISATSSGVTLENSHARIWCRLNTLSNLHTTSAIQVIFETSSGNYRTFSFPASRFTVNIFELLHCDFDDSSKYTDVGTFNRNLITKVYLRVTTTAAQTIQVNWDYFVFVSNTRLIDSYYAGLTMVGWDASNQEEFTLLSEDATVKGKYTMYKPFANNYLIASFYAKEYNGSVIGSEGRFTSGSTGVHAKRVNFQNRIFFPEHISGKRLLVKATMFPDSFAVYDFPSTTSLRISGDQSARLKSGDKIVLYKWRDMCGVGIGKFASVFNTGLNKSWKIVTLSGDSTYSSPYTTIPTTETMPVGADNKDWRVARLGLFMSYFCGNLTDAEIYTALTPVGFMADAGGAIYFQDNFNRANENPLASNNWYSTGSSAGCMWQIYSNFAFVTVSPNAYFWGTSSNNSTAFDTTKLPMELTWTWYFNWASPGGLILFMEVGAPTANPSSGVFGQGLGVSFQPSTYTLQLFNNGVNLTSVSFPVSTSTTYNVKLRISEDNKSMYVKIWAASAVEPIAWTLSYTSSAPFVYQSAKTLLMSWYNLSSGGGASYDLRVDNLQVYSANKGISLLYSQENMSGQKLCLNGFLDRQDTTNDNAVIKKIAGTVV